MNGGGRLYKYIMKTTFDLNFYLYQAFKQHGYKEKWKHREAVNHNLNLTLHPPVTTRKSRRKLNHEIVQELARNYGVFFEETSAKADINVKKVRLTI